MEDSRKAFEDAVFNRYFLSQVTQSMALKDNTLSQAQLCERDGDDYKDDRISAMWFGWKAAMGHVEKKGNP